MKYQDNTVPIRYRLLSKKNTDIKIPNLTSMSHEATRKTFKNKETDKRFSVKNRKIQAMIDGFLRKIDLKLTKLGLNTPEEKHLFIMLFVIIGFSAMCHVTQIMFFCILGTMLLVAVNAMSILIYVICTILLIKKKPAAAGILFSSEISLASLALAYLAGIGTFLVSYFLVVLLIQMIIPYAGWKIRIPMIAMIVMLSLACFAITEIYEPLIDITSIKTAYSVFNILVGSGSVISIVAVNNAVNKVVEQLNKIKLDKYMDEAHLDALTGLYNRRYAKIIFERIHNNTEQHNMWCVAMLDADNFKHINDTYGHEAGDIVLHELAEIIKASVRKTDYVFRWGGEEFLLLLRNAEINDSYSTLDKIRVRIQERKIKIDGRVINLTVTIGLSKCFSGDIGQSIKISDQNLYKGKCTGKNVVVM